MIEKLKDVLGRIEQTEDELRLSGISNETLGGIIDKAKEFCKMTVGEMSDKQLETMCKLIFGQGAKMTYGPIPKNAMVFDPIKYAEHAKAQQQQKLNV